MGPEQGYNSAPISEERAEVREIVEEQASIDRLPEMLGYVETVELGRLRGTIVEGLKGGVEVTEQLTRYHILAEEVVDQCDGRDRASAQIGLIVQMGLIRRDGGLAEASYEDFKDAYAYALNMGMAVAEEVLTEFLLDHAVARLQSLGLDQEDFVMAVYAEAADLGIPDPEGYLRAKGLLEG